MAVACEAMAQDAQRVPERDAMVETIRAYARLEADVLGPQAYRRASWRLWEKRTMWPALLITGTCSGDNQEAGLLASSDSVARNFPSKNNTGSSQRGLLCVRQCLPAEMR